MYQAMPAAPMYSAEHEAFRTTACGALLASLFSHSIGAPPSPGAGGVSALLIDGDTPGLTRTPLSKMDWWCSATAQLHFNMVRVPASHLLGQENRGFEIFMRNFNHQRLALAMQAYALARVCLDEASASAL